MTLTSEQMKRLQYEDGLISQASSEGTADRALREAVREALAPSQIPTVVPEVMAAVGGSYLPIGDALREAAGPTPVLWASVAAAIGAPQDDLGATLRDALVAAAEDAEAEPPSVRRARWPLFVATGVAAAAAAVVAVTVFDAPEEIMEPVAEAIQPVVAPIVKVAKTALPVVTVDLALPGITIIESLESETASVLQVLQFDDDVPTIIFIDEEPGE